MVEHDEETIRWADRLVDVGPGAGPDGGEILVDGPVSEALDNPRSITGRSLRSARARVRPQARSVKGGEFIEIRSIEHHNIRGANVKIPRGRLTLVTGVSGSGKSTLVKDVLVEAITPGRGRGQFKSKAGTEDLKRVVFVDDKPIGKNSRSTPATYVGLLGPIRKHLARVPEARLRGYGPGRFSFNVKGGRCEECAGQGRVKLEMSFLPNSWAQCEVCQGKRYNRQTLHVTAGGLNINEILQLTVSEALEAFERSPKIRKILELMEEVGLGYLSLGQPSTTLSGGEAQRIKLVGELAGRKKPDTVIILDEPTTGLHLADVPRLVGVLHRLVDGGATVVVIEHHGDVIREADWVIDMGPGAGDKGGDVVYMGTVKGLLASKNSLTAKALKKRPRLSAGKTESDAVYANP
jgi:excinuclease ABC subunit A